MLMTSTLAADEAVEAAIRTALAGAPVRSLLDLGTGTGRMLELFGPEIDRRRIRRKISGVFSRAARFSVSFFPPGSSRRAIPVLARSTSDHQRKRISTRRARWRMY